MTPNIVACAASFSKYPPAEPEALLIRPERIASPEAVILNEAQRSEGSVVVLSPSSVATQ
jgi:hypothetical protein